MREVSERELETLSKVLGHTISSDGTKVHIEQETEETPEPVKPKKPFYKNYLFYAALTLAIGSSIALAIAFFIFSVNQTLGDGVLGYFAENELTDEMLTIAGQYNINGLLQAVFIYKNMTWVLGGIGFITFFTALFFFYLDSRRRDLENKELRQKILDTLEEENKLTVEELKVIENSRLE